jgi:hypothetical protein
MPTKKAKKKRARGRWNRNWLLRLPWRSVVRRVGFRRANENFNWWELVRPRPVHSIPGRNCVRFR